MVRSLAKAVKALPAVLVGLIASLACSPLVEAQTAPDLGTVLSKIPSLSTFYELLKKYPDFLLQLPKVDGITVIAPSNDAFKKHQNFTPENKTLVTSLLQYHILTTPLLTTALTSGPAHYFSTLLTHSNYTNVTTGQHVVIYRQSAETITFASGAGTRATLLRQSPSPDTAFAGGTVQAIDTVLSPPPRLEQAARVIFPDMTAFLGALYETGLVQTFAEAQNVTIFVPTNAAFQRVAGALGSLSKEQLARVLRYHLVPGLLPSPQLRNGSVHRTLLHATGNTGSENSGNPSMSVPPPPNLHLLQAGNNLFINSAQLAQPDVLVANGIIHVIDNVLNPDAPAGAQQPNPSVGTQPPLFAATGANVTMTATGSAAPTPFTQALPCTRDCPVTTSAGGGGGSSGTSRSSVTGSGTVRTTSSNGFAARCTGGVAVVGGLLGVGVLAGL